MTYTVFARKYRPQGFVEVVGQDPVVTTLKNALKQNRVAHAYLFTGPRGVGKTSLARILAKALNCEKGPTDEPCNKCDACRAISEGRDIDVIEIDGASNRGIDEVRTVRENVKYLPSRSRFKIYIIDEVHMLTREAFNALLKTLEEPPPHVKFFFATTAPSKLPETVQSRCQRFDLKNVSASDIVKRLMQIAEKEGLDIEDEALKAVARHSRGGLRDAQSLLDQLGSFPDGRITLAAAKGLFGTVGEETVEALVNSLISKDASGALKVVHNVMNQGGDLAVFVDQVVWYLRDLLVVSTCGYNAELLENPWRDGELLERQAKNLTGDTLMYMIQALTGTNKRGMDDLQERIFLETTVVKLAGMEDLESLNNILLRLEELEKKISRSTTTSAGVAAPSRPPAGEYKDSGAKSDTRRVETDRRAAVSEAVEGQAGHVSSQQAQDAGKVWDMAMEHFHNARPSVWSRLKEGKLTGLGSEEAVIAFPKGRPFSKKSLEGNPEDVRLIEDYLGEITGRRLRLRVILSEDVPVATQRSGPPPDALADKSPLESPDKSNIDKIVSLFEGEIVK
ncbi:MAG: DNA polymerase III, subunit gamma and tau [Planctomycetes bacterium RIFCSPLOWO2_12_FULL_50_35]|nr:MAG: DNA polymerase III, subunit gamma and tau [Planctomycetes bacterium RIFCSPLOWO2_12_FULL_50_35]